MAPLPPNARYVSGDYGNRADLESVLEGVDEVVHLAYTTVPQTSFDNPLFDVQSNLLASVQLLQHATSLGLKKFLLVSSGGTVYGPPGSLPIREDHPTNPISPYGITKLSIEKYAGMLHVVGGLPVVTVRPANAYGESQQTHGGQGFIAAAIQSILRGEEVRVFGTRGTVRDYVHVSDIARGVLAALDHGSPGAAYNIGTGIGRDNLEVLREIEPHAAAAGLSVNIRTYDERPFDVAANVLDSSKLSSVSGWRPEIDFKAGIANVFAAFLEDSRRS
jgi:UDP-glucose 4-epimerase